MKVDLEDVNFEELARCTEDFNGAQMKAVAVESGMIALRRYVHFFKDNLPESFQCISV